MGPNYLASGNNSVAMGNGATDSQSNAMALGTNSQATATNAVALGANSNASQQNAIALGYNSTASAPNAVALGANSVANEANTVSVGSVGNERRITNVAAGVNPTDAVNMSQLNGLNNKVDKLGDTLSAGVASAIALQSPAIMIPGKTTMKVGVGYFNGQAAVGVSARKTADSGRWSVTGGVSSGTKGGVAAGAGFEWVLGDD